MKNILLLNGANLNMLGRREPELYGRKNIAEITLELRERANQLGVNFTALHSNAEFELINAIHQAMDKQDFIIINPGAFTHTSIALRDAFLSVALPFIEVHLSNIYKRESFRHTSYLSDIATGVIVGFGAQGYHMALDAAIAHLNKA